MWGTGYHPCRGGPKFLESLLSRLARASVKEGLATQPTTEGLGGTSGDEEWDNIIRGGEAAGREGECK